jgi:hypothetical protein
MPTPEPDIVEFLRTHNQVFLLTHRKDGWPTGYPMVGTYRDDAIEFSAYRARCPSRSRSSTSPRSISAA